MSATASIVSSEPRWNVCGQPGVVPQRLIRALEDIHSISKESCRPTVQTAHRRPAWRIEGHWAPIRGSAAQVL